MKPADPAKHFLGVCRRHGPGVEHFISDRSCCACRFEQTKARRIASRKMRMSAGSSRKYRGKACRACGHRLRHRATGRCVRCEQQDYYRLNSHRTRKAEVSKQARTPNRKRALARGDRYYEGSACVRGHTQRFTRDGSCVECKRTYFARAPRAVVDRARKRQREADRRAYRALKVLQELGIPL
jgi:hypothetical protein